MLKMRSSILRIALFGTLLLGAVAVFGSVASPAQSAQAAVVAPAEAPDMGLARPKVVRCKGIWPQPVGCNGKINAGDIVRVTYKYLGLKKPCTFEFRAEAGLTSTLDAGGLVQWTSGTAACEVIRVSAGSPYQIAWLSKK